MPAQPTRRKIEPGIFERIGADGERRGLEIYFKDAGGKPRRRAVEGGLTEARDALAQARTRRVKHEREPSDPRITFDAVADQFEAAHVATLRLSSQQAYGAALKRLRAAFGPKRITAIKKIDVRNFVAAERAEGLKANSITLHLNVLGTLYSFAREDLDIPVTVPRLRRSERPDPTEDAREHRILTDDEIARVLEALHGLEWLFFGALAETGARESEVLGLAVRRIGASELAIAEQLGRDGKLAPLKTPNSKRTIEVTHSLAAELRLAGGQGLVFGQLSHTGIRRAWSKALRAAKLPDPQPVIHDLRHTHVSGLIADGWDPVEVADRIGDTLATTLKTYTHEFDARRRSEQRRAALETRYRAQDGYRMATDTSPQTGADGAKIQQMQAHRSTVR